MNLNLLQEITHSNSLEEIRKVILMTLNHYGLNDFGYAVQVPAINKRELPYIFTGYDQSWVEHYTSNQYYTVDPTIAYSAKNLVPVRWDDKLFSQCDRFRDESRDAGLRHGATYPIHGIYGEKGLFCIAGKNEISDEVFMQINAMVSFLHAQILDVDLKSYTYFDMPTLTNREAEYLQWLAIGKSMEEIATIMNISYRTAVDYIEKLKKKFQCQSKSQVLALAIKKNIVTL